MKAEANENLEVVVGVEVAEYFVWDGFNALPR